MSGLKITAIIAAHNEEDILAQSIDDLVQQDIGVYLIDHGSTDGTSEVAKRFEGKGLIGIERVEGNEFALEALMHRKEELARELPGDWFINHDADEFRESPWPGITLREGIERVDALGFTAINFELFNFWPTVPSAPTDVRAEYKYFSRAEEWNRLQIRTWKRPRGSLDLKSSGGHEATFAGRKLFPISFVLRHYPFRGLAHAERKLSRERRGRYAANELARGWHQQHRDLVASNVIRNPETLELFEQTKISLELNTRVTIGRDLESSPESVSRELEVARRDLDQALRTLNELTAQRDALSRELHDRNLALTSAQAELAAKSAALDVSIKQGEQFSADLHRRNLELNAARESREAISRELDQRNRELEACRRELDETYRHSLRRLLDVTSKRL
jgi:hypothetical protein